MKSSRFQGISSGEKASNNEQLRGLCPGEFVGSCVILKDTQGYNEPKNHILHRHITA